MAPPEDAIGSEAGLSSAGREPPQSQAGTTAAQGVEGWALALRVIAAALMMLGVAVLLGWVFDVAALKTVFPGLTSMKANTAAGFVLLGVAFWQLPAGGNRPRRTVGIICVAVPASIAALTLAEYVFGVDLGIDQAVFRDSTSWPDSYPGRMSVVTATCFLLIALGYATSRATRRPGTILFLGATVLGQLVALTAVFGYIFGSRLLYSPIPGTAIGVHTATAFLLAFVGLSLARRDLGLVAVLVSDGPGGSLARRLIPAIVAGIPIVAWIRLQGQHAGLYDTAAGVALLALFMIVALSALIWRSGAQVNHLYARLHENERRYRQVVDGIHEAIWLQVDGKLVFANAYAARTFGASCPQDLVGRDALLFVHPEHQARIPATSQLETGTATTAAAEMKMQRLDGTPFDALVHAVTLVEDGTRKILCTARDITDLREAEARLRQSQKMEGIGRLTGGVAHDFNNLLTIIVGNADVLSESDLTEEQKGHANTIVNTALRGADLIKQLLAFSRKQALQPMAIDANEMLTNMETILKRTLGEDVELVVNRRQDLWPMLADAAQLETAILNLAVNARHAMPKGGKLTIETGNVRLDEDYAALNSEVFPGDYVMVAVSDTGSGMPPHVVEKAFEPFFTTKAPGQGTGLGLSMIYGFAKQSRGHVKIYSEVGEGTTVKLYLPRAAGSTAVVAEVEHDLAPTGSETILVVEDDADVRKLAAENPRSLGYTILEAANGPDAMRILRQEPSVDLLFTDIVLPGGMTGRNIADEALKFRPDLKVLYASGYTENAIIHHGRLDPGVNLLPKPYRRAQLGRMVRKTLDKVD